MKRYQKEVGLKVRAPSYLSPVGLLTTLWVVVGVLRMLPLIQYKPLSNEVLAFFFACYLTFVLFYFSLLIPFSQKIRGHPRPELSQLMINRLVRLTTIFAVVGLIGAAVRGIEIYFLRGLDFTQGIAAVRLENIEQVEASGAGQSALSGIARILAAFASIAAMSTLLHWERIPPRRARTVMLLFFLVLCQSILEGGRNTIAVNLLFIASCAVVRLRQGKPAIPGGRRFRRVLSAIAIVLPFFFAYVFIGRFEALGYGASTVMSALETGFNVEISPVLTQWDSEGAVTVAASFVGVVLYLTHSMSELDWLIQWAQTHSAAWGAYNFSLVTVALERLGFENLAFDYNTLDRPGVYITAFGEFVIDFGVAGAIAVCALLGALFGHWWKKVKHCSSIGAELGLGLGIAAAIVSPLYSILAGFLGALVATVLFVLLMHAGPSLRSTVLFQRPA